MFNLLSNAIKYSSEKGEVKLTVEVTDNFGNSSEEIKFSVEDDGIGIALEEQEAVFGKFHKINNAGARKSGAGLGLSVVKSFVELHGGRVELSSQSGAGTKVSCYLPRKHSFLL